MKLVFTRRHLGLLYVAASLAFVESGALLAKTTFGPPIRYEFTGSGDVESQKEDDLTGTNQHRYVLASLYAPVVKKPFAVLPWIDYHQDQRQDRWTMGTESVNLPARRSALGLGLALIGPTVGKSQPMIIAKRIGDARLEASVQPMAELMMGGRSDDYFLPGDEVMILLRYRQFPYTHRFLLLYGWKRIVPGGWFFDLLMPSHGIFGHMAADRSWVVSGGYRGSSRDYPIRYQDQPHWLEGSAVNIFIGGSHRLKGIFHGRFDAGVQIERTRMFDLEGELRLDIRSKPLPFVRFSIETVVESV